MADLSHDSPDDAFHEIQLSGKQLVFLFMATTVISVVIFLCGVLVGRGGVRPEDIGVSPEVAAAAAPAPVSEPLPSSPPATDPPSPPADAQLSYHKRLESERAPAENLKPATGEPPRAEPEAPRAATPPANAKPSGPAGAGETAKPGIWAVQVVSLRDGNAASQLVQRLRTKGYPAYVLAPSAGAPTQLFKVQVGRYEDRAEAEKIEARLKKEEQFDTWIVR